MSLVRVRELLVNRLDEADRGDRGWFVITRVHVSLDWLRGIAEYLRQIGGDDWISLSSGDYERLAEIVEISLSNPGQQLRRHHLLVMDKPLQLLEREDGRLWNSIRLTPLGLELSEASDAAAVLERSLQRIRFAVEPWSPPDRVSQYDEFDVHVYNCTRQVLRACDGYIDRDEFDFFLSRIRNRQEVAWAVDGISQYRELNQDDRRTLHAEVRSRIEGAKAYQNWRDQALHTFSLFSLGTSMVREEQRLFLTETWSEAAAAPTVQAREPRARYVSAVLRMPEPPEAASLLEPPTSPASNVGSDAESFVAKILRSQGWLVAFYTNKRGYGFDLWARKEERAMLIEVKSSVGALGEVSLTSTEFAAARLHGANYLLALVENIGSPTPVLRFIQDPIHVLEFSENRQINYVVPERVWRRVTSEI